MVTDETITLSSCREVWEHMGRSKRIGRMIDVLEQSVDQNPGLVFDTGRALIESVCKTILDDRQVEFDDKWELARLLKATLSSVALVPEPFSEDIADLLRRLGGGLQTATQALGELRNKEGFISHGRTAFWPELDRMHALVAARTAETIVYLVYMAHVNYPPVEVDREPVYGDYRTFNDSFDLANGSVMISGTEYQPSELLWIADRDAYREQFASYVDDGLIGPPKRWP